MGLKADKQDLHELRIAFQAMDTDGDGHLTVKEFIEAEKKNKSGTSKLGKKWDDVLKNVDLDGDGKIDF